MKTLQITREVYCFEWQLVDGEITNESSIHFCESGGHNSDPSCIILGTIVVDVPCTLPHSDVVAQQLAALSVKEEQVRADAEVALEHIEKQRSQLRAITYEGIL